MRVRGPPLKPLVSPHPVFLHSTCGDDVMTTSAGYLETKQICSTYLSRRLHRATWHACTRLTHFERRR